VDTIKNMVTLLFEHWGAILSGQGIDVKVDSSVAEGMDSVRMVLQGITAVVESTDCEDVIVIQQI
jgi:hypothetical protein